MEIVWSPESLEDLEHIGSFMSKDSPSRDNSFVDELLNSVERLTSFPESGILAEENLYLDK